MIEFKQPNAVSTRCGQFNWFFWQLRVVCYIRSKDCVAEIIKNSFISWISPVIDLIEASSNLQTNVCLRNIGPSILIYVNFSISCYSVQPIPHCCKYPWKMPKVLNSCSFFITDTYHIRENVQAITRMLWITKDRRITALHDRSLLWRNNWLYSLWRMMQDNNASDQWILLSEKMALSTQV